MVLLQIHSDLSPCGDFWHRTMFLCRQEQARRKQLTLVLFSCVACRHTAGGGTVVSWVHPLPNSAPSPRALRGELAEHRLDHSLVKQPVLQQPWIVWLGEGELRSETLGRVEAQLEFASFLPIGMVSDQTPLEATTWFLCVSVPWLSFIPLSFMICLGNLVLRNKISPRLLHFDPDHKCFSFLRNELFSCYSVLPDSSCTGYFSHHCGQIPKEKRAKGGRCHSSS